MDFIETMPNLKEYIELLPICVVGIVTGTIKYIQADKETYTKKQIISDFATSSFLCVVIYAILSAADLPYLAKIGIASAIAYYGIDRALEIVKQIISLKGTKSDKS